MKTRAVKSIPAVLFPLLLVGCAATSLDRRAEPGKGPHPPTDREDVWAPPTEGPKTPLANLEDALVFRPTRFPDGNWNPRGSNWDRGALAVEDAWFHASDGTKLHGWYYPHEQARAVVLFCHGSAGNLSHRADLVRYLHDHHKLSVMVFDYRGYGRSEGEPDEYGILQDARAARAWLAGRAGIAEKDIVLMGRALGGAVAVDLAIAGDAARGLILESTFTSLPDVAKIKVPFAGALMRSRLNSLAKIGRYKGPLLQSHGDADRVIPYPNGLKLFEAANEPKQLVTIHGADHHYPQSVEYYQALDRFLDSLPPIQQAAGSKQSGRSVSTWQGMERRRSFSLRASASPRENHPNPVRRISLIG